MGSVTGELPSHVRFGLWGGALVALFGCHLALYSGTIVDDAFIMFRYARNLADGLGLVFNAGERVEGISSLLWTLWIAAGLKLGLNPEGFAAGSGALLGLAAMAYVSWRFHWLLALVLACSGPFVYWCVAGLETPLFVAVLFVALGELYHAVKDPAPRRPLLVSAAAFGLLHWIRPDGIYFLVSVGVPLVALRRRNVSSRDLSAAACLAFLPYVALLAWRYAYFGELQPNTYYAKVAMPWHDGFWQQFQMQGLPYVRGFWSTYPVLGALAVTGLVLAVRARDGVLLIFHTGLLIYQCYLVFVGGDWMPQYRWYVPLIAVYAALALAVCKRRWIAGAVAAALCATLVHQSVFGFVGGGTLRFLDKNTDFSRVLAREFRSGVPWSQSVLLGDIGMMGWLSDMRVVDAAGLADKHIARQPAIHFWKNDTAYLLACDAEWVIIRYHYWWYPPDATTRREFTRRIAAQPDEMLFTPDFWQRNWQLGRWTFEQALLRSPEFHARYATLTVWPEIDQPQYTAVFCRRDVCSSPIAERLRTVAPTLGEAKAEAGRPDADRYLRRTFEIIPNEESAMVALAARTHDRETLRRIALRWGALISDRVSAHTALGLDSYGAKRFDEALESFAAAARLDGSAPYQLSNVGWALKALGRTEEAERWFARSKRG
jgi:arabinofuranosyltransferase